MLLPDEYNILCQMRIIDREVFYYLDQRMDRETGLIGQSVHVSYGGMALDISERMTPGRRDALLVFDSTAIRHAVERLVSAGLLCRMSQEGKRSRLLVTRVFFVDLLHARKSAKKQVGKRLVEGCHGDDDVIANKNNALCDSAGDRSVVGSAEVGRTINSIITTEADKPIAMTLDWSPTESDLRAILFRAVGSKHRLEDIDPAWLAGFVGYWSGMPGRQMTQQQWTAKYASDVVRYFRDPDFARRKFGGGGAGSDKPAAYDANSRALPDWARLPRADDELVSWAKRFGYGDPDMGDGWIEFRAKLKQKINRRLGEQNIAKVSW